MRRNNLIPHITSYEKTLKKKEQTWNEPIQHTNDPKMTGDGWVNRNCLPAFPLAK